jgi:hypothetical protein
VSSIVDYARTQTWDTTQYHLDSLNNKVLKFSFRESLQNPLKGELFGTNSSRMDNNALRQARLRIV